MHRQLFTLTSHAFKSAYKWANKWPGLCVKNSSFFFFVSWCLTCVSFPGHRSSYMAERLSEAQVFSSGCYCWQICRGLQSKTPAHADIGGMCPCAHAAQCACSACTPDRPLQLMHVPLLPNTNAQWERKPPHAAKHSEPWVKEAATKEICTDFRTEYIHTPLTGRSAMICPLSNMIQLVLNST